MAWVAFEDVIRHAQQRETVGKPAGQHRGIGHMLTEMATKLEAAPLLVHCAAMLKGQARRCDLEAGDGEDHANQVARQIAPMSLRIHDGYAYPQEYDTVRYYRDTPHMIVGDGTSEIQNNVTADQRIEGYRLYRSESFLELR